MCVSVCVCVCTAHVHVLADLNVCSVAIVDKWLGLARTVYINRIGPYTW